MIAYAKTPLGFWMKAEILGTVLARLEWQRIDFEAVSEHADLREYLLSWFAQTTADCRYTIQLVGTPFQMKVWRAVQRIPWGSTKTYRQIAQEIGSPMAQQAVGQACKKNAIPILIPCHRVIGQNQSMIGYCGLEHVEIKMALLDWERTG